MTEDRAKLGISLSNDEALVLFEFLARLCNDQKLVIEDGAERQVLCSIYCQLESLLVEPLDPGYLELLGRARRALRPTRA